MYTLPHCGPPPVVYAVAALWECVARAAATWSAIVGRGGRGWRRGKGESKVESFGGLPSMDQQGIWRSRHETEIWNILSSMLVALAVAAPSRVGVYRLASGGAVPSRTSPLVMSSAINNPCPRLPPPVSSAERDTVTLGMG